MVLQKQIARNSFCITPERFCKLLRNVPSPCNSQSCHRLRNCPATTRNLLRQANAKSETTPMGYWIHIVVKEQDSSIRFVLELISVTSWPQITLYIDRLLSVLVTINQPCAFRTWYRQWNDCCACVCVCARCDFLARSCFETKVLTERFAPVVKKGPAVPVVIIRGPTIVTFSGFSVVVRGTRVPKMKRIPKPCCPKPVGQDIPSPPVYLGYLKKKGYLNPAAKSLLATISRRRLCT